MREKVLLLMLCVFFAMSVFLIKNEFDADASELRRILDPFYATVYHSIPVETSTLIDLNDCFILKGKDNSFFVFKKSGLKIISNTLDKAIFECDGVRGTIFVSEPILGDRQVIDEYVLRFQNVDLNNSICVVLEKEKELNLLKEVRKIPLPVDRFNEANNFFTKKTGVAEIDAVLFPNETLVKMNNITFPLEAIQEYDENVFKINDVYMTFETLNSKAIYDKSLKTGKGLTLKYNENAKIEDFSSYLLITDGRVIRFTTRDINNLEVFADERTN